MCCLKLMILEFHGKFWLKYIISKVLMYQLHNLIS